MPQITVRSPLLAAKSEKPLTPAQRAVVWEICALLDEQRLPPDPYDAVWLEVPSARLRGSWGRNDNWWLRECLERLLGVKFSGQDGDGPWGAVLLAEFKIERDTVRLLLPPSAIRALRLPQTFAKIDAEAAHRLPPNARTLYGLIADKFRQKNQAWEVDIEDLKALLGMDEDRHKRFVDFRRYVLDPAVKAITEFGICTLTWEPIRPGRSVTAIRFQWLLKQPGEAEQTARENDRHSTAKGRSQESAGAPPLVPDDVLAKTLEWLNKANATERSKWASRAVELGAPRFQAMSAKDYVARWAGYVAAELAATERL